jgi:hypothetical protein
MHIDKDNITFSAWVQNQFGKSRKKNFTAEQKEMLRPLAETIAILDGNAFFGLDVDDNGEDRWYEQYLPEAWLIYKANAGDRGWITQTSWMRNLEHENDTVRDAYAQWQLLKKLSKRR